MTQSSPRRMVGIDLARSLAIFLAMTSHGLTVCQGATFFSNEYLDLLRPLLHAATPTFIVLFGSMLAIAYLPRFGEQPHEITARLISRGMQCWLLYALSVVVLYMTTPGYSVAFSISTIFLLGVTPFTDILKFYAIALFVSPLLLHMVRRHGVGPLLALSFIVHLAHPVIDWAGTMLDIGLPIEAVRVTTFLFGVGDAELAGPSVLHGLTLVIFGMALSRWLISSKKHHAWGVLALAATLLISVAAIAGPDVFTRDAMSLRAENHPLYFLVGIGSASTLASTAVLVTRRTQKHKGWTRLTFFGRTSLFTFAFGNMLLYCVRINPQTREQALGWTIALTACIVLLSFAFDRVVSRKGLAARAISALRTNLDWACAVCVQRVLGARIRLPR